MPKILFPRIGRRIVAVMLILAISSTHALADNPRQLLEEKGVAFQIGYVLDGTRNLRGGLSTVSSAWRELFDINATLSSQKLLNFEGGTAFIDFQSAHGPNASDRLVGDVQGIDGIDGVPLADHQDRDQFSQYWYEQKFFGEMVRWKFGKVDANTEFDHSDTAQDFLHQSAGSSATLFTLPTYPDAATGVNLFLKPIDGSQLGIAVYDGSVANGFRTGERGLHNFIRDDADQFYIGEANHSWEGGELGLGGKVGLGGWYSTNDFSRLDGEVTSGTGGFYGFLDQQIWRAQSVGGSDKRGASLFMMYGYSDPKITIYGHNIGGGISWHGPLMNRADDAVGIGFQSIRFSDGFAPDAHETAYEIFYHCQLMSWLILKPDLQYITNPGGKDTNDALALTLRLELHL